MKIGVLASQGAFAEHISALDKLDVEAAPVRLPRELEGLDGLILPGGESTTISKMMAEYKLVDAIRNMAAAGLPLLGTCAGMILLSKDVIGNGMLPLGLMDISVRRNAFGRQLESFETELAVPVLGEDPFHAVFIRAPLIEKCKDGVDVLAELDDGTVVAARQQNLLATSFHPELTDDLRLHRYFVEMAAGGR